MCLLTKHCKTIFTVFLDWTNKNNFSSGLLWAGFKTFKPFAPLKIFSAVHKCSTGGFFAGGICTSSITALLLHLFFCVRTRGLDHIWKKSSGKAESLSPQHDPFCFYIYNAKVFPMLLSAFEHLQEFWWPDPCWAVGNGSGCGEQCCCPEPVLLLLQHWAHRTSLLHPVLCPDLAALFLVSKSVNLTFACVKSALFRGCIWLNSYLLESELLEYEIWDSWKAPAIHVLLHEVSKEICQEVVCLGRSGRLSALGSVSEKVTLPYPTQTITGQ